jgi:methylated-DNA-protein-cysteine methyltransferase related protein
MNRNHEPLEPQCNMGNRFRDLVYVMVKEIPNGKVMTYGQIAALCGHPGAAQVVGQIAHFGPSDIPWHRVVNAKGGLASGFPWGGRKGHAKLLEAEGVKLTENRVDIKELLWWPKN